MSKDLCRQLAIALNDSLASAGLSHDVAAQVSTQTIEHLQAALGGQSLYLPRRPAWFSKSARDQAISSAFNGRNLDEVCRRFQVSRSTVYRVCGK